MKRFFKSKKKKISVAEEENIADAAKDLLDNAAKDAKRARDKLVEANDILDRLCEDLLKGVVK